MLLAYVGPGAGFALAGSMLVVLATFALALSTMLTWPVRLVWRAIRVGNPYKKARATRVVVLGLDGMDPGLLTRYMLQGRLPNFSKLADKGVFRPLDTSHPSMSPVAWSTFSTGVDASRHGIYDFLTRDPCTYQPVLSSTDIGKAKRVLAIGKYVIPLSKPRIKLLQKSRTFWSHLGDRHIFSTIQRVPITFPPVKFNNGLLLSGMCVPDLRGSQGTFSYFSTRNDDGHAHHTGGEQTVLRRKGDVIRSRIVGPDHSLLKSGGRMTLPFTLTVRNDRSGARLEIEGCDPVELEVEAYTPWIRLTFAAGLGIKVRGIARFYLNSCDDEVELYMTPVHIDPENPAMPISQPSVYSVYLAKKQGPFATLGLAEDTWALNEGVIDEKAFLQQALDIFDEREKMLFDAIAHTKKGFVTTVFDTTDRVQHMFYRFLDPTHPANRAREVRHDDVDWSDTIAQVYERCDAMLGRLMRAVDDDDTVLMVISDHGFTNFRRGVNLNAWLRDNGYLALKGDLTTSADWFEDVDWSRTRAFALGLTGIFINRKGREKSGIVAEGEEYRALCDEIIAKLEHLVDPETGGRCVRRVLPSARFFDGPYRMDAPDLLIGYEGGYRNGWQCAVGAVTEHVFHDNLKAWSGDHCVDPHIVPGVFLANRPIANDAPHLIDVPASVLNLFGLDVPKYMQGSPLFPADAADATTRGMLDPHSLEQSGAAPGALVFGPEPMEKAQ